jgi:LTXXQ motif family protein
VINIRSTLAAAALVLGTAVVASAQQPTQAPAARAQRAERAQGHRRGAFGPGALRHQLFKGIQLTAAEKANVKNVQQKYAPQMKALRAQMKPQLEAARAARQKGDTAALKAMWQKSSAQREQVKTLLDAERNDLRAALTPEHQTQFDANVKKFEQRVANRATRMWKNGGKAAVGQNPRG